MAETNVPRKFIRQLLTALTVALLGVALEYAVLISVDRLVDDFPRVSDVLMDRLPLIQFGWVGEALFFSLVAIFAWRFFRRQWRDTPRVLVAIGLYYSLRAIFLLLLPIGSPDGAAPIANRLNIWGFANHAYFPGGHIGILTILTLSVREGTWRRWLWVGVIAFGIGSLLNKTHYAADSIAGIMLGAGVWTWLDRRRRG